MKLYRVEITRTMYVLAPSAREAESTATRERYEPAESDLYTEQVTVAADIDPNWLDALPYRSASARDERTIRRLIEDEPGLLKARE